MLFRRREAPNWMERLRVWVWPRNSWSRSARYFGKRVMRLTATPHVVAIGFAAGVFASFTPFVGLHFLISFVIAFFVGGNMIAAALGTMIGNPISFPLIWVSTYNVGSLILGQEPRDFDAAALSRGVLQNSMETLLPILKPMLIGCLPIGGLIGLVFYFVVRAAVSTYQNGRKERLKERAQLREGGGEGVQ